MPISEDVRRFVVARIPSVAHLEALLLLRSTGTPWPLQELSARLYLSTTHVEALVDDLQARELAVRDGECARYLPKNETLAQAVDALSAAYGKRLVDVTRLIHSMMEKKAHRFADAFNVRKDR